MTRLTVFMIALAAFTDQPAVLAGTPVGTTFTYQGQLKEAGAPRNGNVDLLFELFDAEVDGNPIGSLLLVQDVPVVKGLLSVDLDFGAAVFTGNARWMQIQVRSPHDPGDTEPFTPLSPRQPLTGAPFALFSLAPWQQNGPDVSYSDGNVGIGTTSPADEIHLRSNAPGMRLEDDNDPSSYGLLEQSQPGLLRLENHTGPDVGSVIDFNPSPSDGVSSAEIRVFRETSTSGLKRVTFFRGDNTDAVSATIGVNGEDSYFQLHGGNVGIGTNLPDARLHVKGGLPALPTGGGFIQAGSSTGPNVVIDNNEMMARLNGATSTLTLNKHGGDVIFGGGIQVNENVQVTGNIQVSGNIQLTGKGSVDLGHEIITNINNGVGAIATCSPGKRVVGGGCNIDASDPIVSSRPLADGTGWKCFYDQGLFGIHDVTAYAICINVP